VSRVFNSIQRLRGNPMTSIIFHLAFPVGNLAETKRFYVEGLGCEVGRESPGSVILNLGGHQLVAHVTKADCVPQMGIYPRHFGLVFQSQQDWQDLYDRAQAQNLNFRETARVRFIGTSLEHSTFFLEDPFCNLLEFKYYVYPEAIFGDRHLDLIGDQ
jgi:uncharacterized protein